jgi:hypothetical protein
VATPLSFTYSVLSAPSGSVWDPSPVVTTVVTNDTQYVDTPSKLYMFLTFFLLFSIVGGGLYARGTTATYTTTTTTSTPTVTLLNGAEPYLGCFAADLPGTYTVELDVTGYCGDSIVSVATLQAACNTRPVANIDVTGGNEHFLWSYVVDGTQSVDSDNDNLTYFWSVVSAPGNSYLANTTADPRFEDAFAAETMFTPDVSGDYGLRLTVSDGCSNGTVDYTLTVTCNNNLAIKNPEREQSYDGLMRVSLTEFDFVATEKCDLSQSWTITSYEPAQEIPPTTTGGGVVSDASALVYSVFVFVSMLALFL